GGVPGVQPGVPGLRHLPLQQQRERPRPELRGREGDPMITGRTRMNIAAFLTAAFLLIYLGMTQLVMQPGGGRTVKVDFTDASGLMPRNDVTMRGVPVGAVKTVTLLPNGLAQVELQLERGVTIGSGAKAEITRRSPIGDLTVDLSPGTGKPMADGALISVKNTV